jgi:hypothetical protein
VTGSPALAGRLDPRLLAVHNACELWDYSLSGKYDKDGVRLVAGHYSRRKPSSPQFMPPGETIVTVAKTRDAVWGWWRPHPDSGLVAMNGRDGWTCSVFANHGEILSSELVLDAERALAALDAAKLTAGPCGPDGMLTYVWRSKVKSPNPGYCYKVAGWTKIGTCARGSKDLLWKPLELAGIAACGALRNDRLRSEPRR